MGLKAELVSTEDVWQNGQYLQHYDFPIGNFFLTVSNWEIPFVVAEDFEQENRDNTLTLAVAEVLVKTREFEKVSRKALQ